MRRLGSFFLFGMLALGCGKSDPPADDSPRVDASCVLEGTPAARDVVGEWLDVEIPGAVCADGSPYRIFVKYAAKSHDLAITFEGGGACWDYETCSGARGQRGAANLHGIAPDHMTALPPPLGSNPDAKPWSLLQPHLGQVDPDVATGDFHQVFFPYCTGDVFAGDVSVEYENPDGEPLVMEHRGRANVKAALPWLREEFPEVARLLITGCSAGGVGALINYSLLRDELDPLCGFGLDDSGPLMSEAGFSGLMLNQVRETWQLDGLLEEFDGDLGASREEGTQSDMGHLLPLLSRAYADDRFLVTLFGRDLNFSLFSYQLFYEDPPDEEVFRMWTDDTTALRAQIDELDNVGYFMPAFRPDNCSHCLSLIPVNQLEVPGYTQNLVQGRADVYLGTELDDARFDDALEALLTTEPLPRAVETPSDDDAFSSEESLACR